VAEEKQHSVLTYIGCGIGTIIVMMIVTPIIGKSLGCMGNESKKQQRGASSGGKIDINVSEGNSEGLPDNQKEIARKGARAIMRECVPLQRCKQDIEYIDSAMNWEPSYSSVREWFGWGHTVQVDVKIKDRATCRDTKTYRAQGHTLHYIIGSGEQPGIFGNKEQTRRMCGLDPNTGWKGLTDPDEFDLSSAPHPHM